MMYLRDFVIIQCHDDRLPVKACAAVLTATLVYTYFILEFWISVCLTAHDCANRQRTFTTVKQNSRFFCKIIGYQSHNVPGAAYSALPRILAGSGSSGRCPSPCRRASTSRHSAAISSFSASCPHHS